MKIKVLDLFSGIGGFSLGLERAGMETVAFCEIEPYCQQVLNKHWPDVPLFDDVRKLTKDDLPDDIGLICGGYPCQPLSLAGKREGAADDRHLWPEVARLISEIRPRWFIGENVAGHISMGLDEVLSDLEGLGYAWEAFVIPACALDAHHRRDRVWIVAHSEIERGRPGFCENGQIRNRDKSSNSGGTMANPDNKGLQGPWTERSLQERSKTTGYGGQSCEEHGWSWPTESGVCRILNGVPNRVDRLKALGNAVVPQIPEIIGKAILEIEATRRAVEIVGGMHTSPEALRSAADNDSCS